MSHNLSSEPDMTVHRISPNRQRQRILSRIALPDGLGLRTQEETDLCFMRHLFKATRTHLWNLPLTRSQIDSLIEQQYQLQQAHYARQWPNAASLVIQLSDNSIGKVTLDLGDTTLHIIDFAIDPAMRGKGYGTAILRALQTFAEKYRLQISLSVDRQNPKAKKLYATLGFQVSKISGSHESMLWPPDANASSGSAPQVHEASQFMGFPM